MLKMIADLFEAPPVLGNEREKLYIPPIRTATCMSIATFLEGVSERWVGKDILPHVDLCDVRNTVELSGAMMGMTTDHDAEELLEIGLYTKREWKARYVFEEPIICFIIWPTEGFVVANNHHGSQDFRFQRDITLEKAFLYSWEMLVERGYVSDGCDRNWIRFCCSAGTTRNDTRITPTPS